MGFDLPAVFLCLLVLLPLVYVLRRGIGRTAAVARMFRGRVPGRAYTAVKVGALIVFIASLVTAGARPYIEPRQTGEYLFLADVSRSMLARNYCSEPTMLERAKDVMHRVMNAVPEGRFGVMVFDRLAFPVTQMTYDHDYLHVAIDNGVDVGMIFEATATSLPNALTVAARKKENFPELYGEVGYLILLSDGHMEGDWRPEMEQAIAELRAADLTVLTVGIGNPGETPVPRLRDGACVDDYLEVNGRVLRIPLRDDLLKFIATETGGEYFGEGAIDELTVFLRRETLTGVPEDAEFDEAQRLDVSWFFLLASTLALFVFLLI